MAGRFKVETVFKAIDQITAPVSRMQSRIGKFTRAIERGVHKASRSLDGFNNGLKKVGVASAASLAIAGGAMADVIATGAKFEQSVINAVAKFPGEIQKGSAEFKNLENAAKTVGKTTEFSASQAADALNFLAMAGLNADQSVSALPAVVDLATAANVDLARATDVATDSLGAFGLATKDGVQLGKNLARVNDVIAKTVTSANTDVESLFETIKDGGPVATSAGASLETFAALAGQLANAGIKGSRAGTTLKNMFVRLQAPSATAGKLLKRMGVQTKDANGDMLDIVKILGQLDKGLAGLGTAEKAGVLNEIFGKIPIAGVNVLLKTGTKRLNDYRKEIEASAGSSKKMADVMRDSVIGRFNSLKSVIEGVKISIFSMNNDAISKTLDRMTEWIRLNEGLISQKIGEFLKLIVDNLGNLLKLGAGFVAFAGFMMGVSAALKLVTLATTAFTMAMGIGKGAVIAFKVAFAAMQFIILALPKALMLAKAAMVLFNIVLTANPIGAIVTAVGLLIAAAALLIVAWDPVKKFFVDLWDSLVSGFNKVIEVFKTGKDIMGSVGKVFDFISGGSSSDDQTTASTQQKQIVTPEERVARSIEEKRESSKAEVTIRDESGRAELTGGKLGAGLKLQASGGF